VQLSFLTTILELAGMLAIVAGVALAVALLFMPAGLLVGGSGLLFMAWLIDSRQERAAKAAAARRQGGTA
jgi:hypothetical protein